MAMIRGLDFRVDTVGAVVVFNLKVVVVMLGIILIHLFNLRVNLVDQFKQLFRLLMKVILVLVDALLREVTSL